MSNIKEALANWDAADELLAEKIEKFEGKEYFISSNYTNAAVDTYEYTGLSVKVEANTPCLICAYDKYSYAAPTAICIADTSDVSALSSGSRMIAENAVTASTSKNFAIRTVSGIAPILPTETTYYIFVKRSAVGNNSIGVWAKKLN